MSAAYFLALPLVITGVFADAAFEAKSEKVRLDTKNGVYYLTGHVQVKISNKVFEADKVVIYMEQCNNKPSRIIATGEVKYNDIDNTVKARMCKSDMKTVTFLQDVTIEGKEYGELEADRLVYEISSKKIKIFSHRRVKLVLGEKVENKIKQAVLRKRKK